MKFIVRRWSDSAGGPAGLPSYSGSSGIAAAGVDTNIQFNDGGSIGADNSLTYSKASKSLGVNGLQIVGLQNEVIANNQVSPTPVISFSAAAFPSAMIDYSITRDGGRRTGRIMIASNGIDLGVDEEGIETPTSPGVLLSADMNSGNIEISYTSTNSGSAGTLTYSIRRWA